MDQNFFVQRGQHLAVKSHKCLFQTQLILIIRKIIVSVNNIGGPVFVGEKMNEGEKGW